MEPHGFAFSQPNGPLAPAPVDIAAPAAGQAVIRVAGCGVCHTDLSFYTGAVRPRHPLPLILGHEISGTVEAAGSGAEHLVGRNVIVPAVMPCGECHECLAGCSASCKRQFMPGNDGHGGFATHVVVPARDLAVLPDRLNGYNLADLSVIADAVSTPYQSVLRAGVGAGDFAVFVGTGGIGTYGVQIAAALGATVLALDVDQAKLDRISGYGAARTINIRGMDAGAVRKAVRSAAGELGAPAFGWKVFEMSGTAASQQTAFSLIPPSGTLAVVGFTTETVPLRLSNLMALDATCFGNWGCAPSHYPACIDLVLSGRITLKPFIRHHPLTDIAAVFDHAHHGKLTERAILVPGDN